MPIRFAARDSLAQGRRPREVPPPGGGLTSGAMVSPAANELPALAQVSGDNLHLQGTPMRPGFSAQVETLRRPVMYDPEAAGTVGAPDKLGAMATRATLAMDRPEQALQRMGMDGNNSGPRLQTEMLSAGSLVGAVTASQQAQKALGQQRLMNQQMAQASGADMTGAMADAQAFSIGERMKRMDPQALAALDNLEARMMRPGSTFAI